MMEKIIKVKDMSIEKIILIINSMNTFTKDSIVDIKNNIEENKEWYIVILMFSLYLFSKHDLNEIVLCGVVLYGSVLMKQYIRHRIEKETLDSLDLDKISNKEKNNSIIDILNTYIENCFDRDVLFYAVIKHDDYIDAETEKRLLDELLDSALLNMSDEVRLKLSKYLGSENLIRIMGRICMTTVTIFVANHNKNIYQKTENKKVEI